jgi:hypothetical protein
MNDLKYMVTRNKCLENVAIIDNCAMRLSFKCLIFILNSYNEILFIFSDSLSRLIIRFSCFVYDELLLIKYDCNLCEILLLKQNLFSVIPSELFEKRAPEGLITYFPDNSHTGKLWK